MEMRPVGVSRGPRYVRHSRPGRGVTCVSPRATRFVPRAHLDPLTAPPSDGAASRSLGPPSLAGRGGCELAQSIIEDTPWGGADVKRRRSTGVAPLDGPRPRREPSDCRPACPRPGVRRAWPLRCHCPLLSQRAGATVANRTWARLCQTNTSVWLSWRAGMATLLSDRACSWLRQRDRVGLAR